MRNLFWRCLAVALAAVLGWTLWQRPTQPATVEFALEPPCGFMIAQRPDGQLECWLDGKRIVTPPPQRE